MPEGADLTNFFLTHQKCRRLRALVEPPVSSKCAHNIRGPASATSPAAVPVASQRPKSRALSPGVEPLSQVQVVGGPLLHSKKNGDGYVDSDSKMEKILAGVATALAALKG